MNWVKWGRNDRLIWLWTSENDVRWYCSHKKVISSSLLLSSNVGGKEIKRRRAEAKQDKLIEWSVSRTFKMRADDLPAGRFLRLPSSSMSRGDFWRAHCVNPKSVIRTMMRWLSLAICICVDFFSFISTWLGSLELFTSLHFVLVGFSFGFFSFSLLLR